MFFIVVTFLKIIPAFASSSLVSVSVAVAFGSSSRSRDVSTAALSRVVHSTPSSARRLSSARRRVASDTDAAFD